MTKKFTLMMFFFLLIGAASFSQTATLATVSASPGQNVPVALNVTGFSGIGSITFYIRFKPSVMAFTGTSNPSMGVTFFSNVSDSTISIVWSGPPMVNFPDGKLLDLNISYNGMTTSPLHFFNCEVTQGLTPIFPSYSDGSVSMAIVPQTATLLPASAGTGGNVSVPIDYENFNGSYSSIGALTQKIHYDPTKLTFVSVTGVGSLAVGTTYSNDLINGIISIAWTKTGGAAINWPNQFLLNFVYIGNTATNLDFIAGCLISTSSVPGTNVPVTYYGGTVSLTSGSTATAVLGSVTGVLQGSQIEVPMTLNGFPTGGVTGPTEAFTLTIPYNYPRLSFVGVKSPVPAGLVVSQNPGTITLAWSDPTGLTNINGNFLTLKFEYDGIGIANVGFGNGCVFNTNNGAIGTVQVTYTNATITPAVVPANATIGFVQGTTGSNVNVPINFSGLPANNMGAVTLFITYDYSKLTFIDAQNNIFGANIGNNVITHIVSITWSSANPTELNGKFLDLRFAYNCGGSNCGAAVSFTDNGTQNCELTDHAINIVPANWYNGGVNLTFMVSGHLLYDNAPNTNIPVPGTTILVKDGPEPVPPALSPVPNIVTSTTTDVNGYYSVSLSNGTYYLYASNAPAWGGVGQPDVTNLRRYIAILTPNTITGDPLRILASDINWDGLVNNADVTPLRRRIANLTPNPNYMAPDWVFQNPMVVVSGANLSNIDFLGICSGDVNGSYPDPNAK